MNSMHILDKKTKELVNEKLKFQPIIIPPYTGQQSPKK